MRRFITALSIFLFLLLSIYTTTAFGNPVSLPQGLYSLKDTQLVTGINYDIQNNSSSKTLLIIVDSSQLIQELMRLEPNSPKYILKPLNYGDIIIIIGGNLEFS